MRAAPCIVLFLCAFCACSTKQDIERARKLTGGEPARGQQALDRYGCGACHHIPDVRGARGTVGPDLSGFALRSFIAGRLPNHSDALIQWIRDPQAIEPGTAMPSLGVSEHDARDMAAYLYTLTQPVK